MRAALCWSDMGIMDQRLFRNASLREEYLEYVFLAGYPLPGLWDRVAKHTKANSAGVKKERNDRRVLAKGKFKMLGSYDDVFDHLFDRPS
ncbi:MAG: hypothetical protein AAF922_12325 [Pseudomonadota bacterium]